MNTKKILIILAALLVVGFAVWKFATPKETQAPVVSEQTPSVTAPATSIVGATLNDMGHFVYKSNTEFLTVEAEYPSKTPLAPAADAKVRLAIENWVKGQTADFTKMVNTDLLDAQEQARLREDGRQYAMGINFKEYTSLGYVSYVFTEFEDTGGAHPNTVYPTLTFTTNGDKVELADLFTPGTKYLDRLSAASYTYIAADAKKRFSSDLDASQKEWIRTGTAPTLENLQFFYLDGSDLVIVFPPYQVAAYAAGMFEAHIPFSSLKDILKK